MHITPLPLSLPVQDELPSEVNCPKTSTHAAVRNITVSDQEGTEIAVALWRTLTTSPVKTGDFVLISHVVSRKYRGDVTLQTTSHTAVQVTICSYFKFQTLYCPKTLIQFTLHHSTTLHSLICHYQFTCRKPRLQSGP